MDDETLKKYLVPGIWNLGYASLICVVIEQNLIFYEYQILLYVLPAKGLYQNMYLLQLGKHFHDLQKEKCHVYMPIF